MEATFVLRFVPTPNDYIQSWRRMMLQQLHTWIFLGVVVFVIAMALSPIFFADWSNISLDEIEPLNFLCGFLPSLFLPIVFIVALLILPQFEIGRQVQKNERLISETEWQVSDDVIVVKNRFCETKMDWGTYQRVIVTKDHYLFVTVVNPRLVHFLPRRAFESNLQEIQFRELLKRKGLLKV